MRAIRYTIAAVGLDLCTDRRACRPHRGPFRRTARDEVQKYFVQHGRYTAGTATRYKPSIITGEPTHQHLAKGLPIGMRLHSAPVIRLADAKAVQLGHVAKADGRWRIFAFADAENPAAPSSRLRALGGFLLNVPTSPVRRYTPAGADIDSVIDILAVLQQGHRALNLETMPAFLLQREYPPPPEVDQLQLLALACLKMPRPFGVLENIAALDNCRANKRRRGRRCLIRDQRWPKDRARELAAG